MSGGGLPSLPLRFGPLALALHGRLLVVGPPLHFLEHSALQHLPLEGLQRRLDLVIDDLDPQWRQLPPSARRLVATANTSPRSPPWAAQDARGLRTRASQALPGLTPFAVTPAWGRILRRATIRRRRQGARPSPRPPGPGQLRCRVPATSPRDLDGSGQDTWRDSRGWSSQQGSLPCITTVVH